MNNITQRLLHHAASRPSAPPFETANEPVAVYPVRVRTGYETVNEFACYRTGTMGEPQARRQFDNGGRTKTEGIGTRRGGPAR